MKTKPQMNWHKFLNLFSEENRDRPTRIGVFQGTPDSMMDFWIENGLPLAGIDVDPRGQRGPEVEIMLDNRTGNPANMTRRVIGARFVKITLSATGEADGLEITNDNNETTVLHFEDASVDAYVSR